MSVNYVSLPNRGQITITGDDRHGFLQGLITQDINLLNNQRLIYACLLTPNGKFLHDFFIFEMADTIIIDCEGGARTHDLFKRLSNHKLRSKVSMEMNESHDVWQIFGNNTVEYDEGLYRDSRHIKCGYRCYNNSSMLKDIQSVDFAVWDRQRIINEIPDGSRDLIPEKSFIHESDIIINTAVSYTKGCYMGQELVSRMHHRGLTKKILKCVNVNTLPDDCELRSSCDDIGLALVKI